jgi:hypothetical protein
MTENTLPIVAAPERAVLFRRFHHSILVPLLRLDARSLENIAINTTDNDITLMAADICISCFHFIEHASHEDRALAAELEKFIELRLLSDIANTRKHLRRHKAARQVELIGRLAFEIAGDMFGFIQTEVIALDSKGVEHDVLDLLLGFLEYVRRVADFGPPMTIKKPRPREYLRAARTRLTYRTVAMEGSSYCFYRSNPDGSYRRAEGGFEGLLEVVPDIGAEEIIGRFKLQFDLPQILKWFDEPEPVPVEVPSRH